LSGADILDHTISAIRKILAEDVEPMLKSLKGLSLSSVSAADRVSDLCMDHDVDVGEALAVGVDGSMVPMGRIASKAIYLVTASSVAVRRVKEGFEVVWRRSRASISSVEVSPSEDDTKAFASLDMLRLELEEAASIGEDVNVLMFDGPVIDPPSIATTLNRAGNDLLKYIELRADVVEKFVERGITTIGIVKRFSGSFLSSEIGLITDDSILAHYVLLRLAKAVSNICRSRSIIATRVFSLYRDGSVIGRILKDRGLQIVSSYVLLNSRVVRVDTVLPKGSNVDVLGVLRLVYLFSEGSNLPLPVLLAHKECSVRVRTARKLFRRILVELFSEGDVDESSISFIITPGDASWRRS